MNITKKVLNQLPERFIIAYDGRYHIRETLSVHHNDINGEVSYDALPLGSGNSIEEALSNTIYFLKENKK